MGTYTYLLHNIDKSLITKSLAVDTIHWRQLIHKYLVYLPEDVNGGHPIRLKEGHVINNKGSHRPNFDGENLSLNGLNALPGPVLAIMVEIKWV